MSSSSRTNGWLSPVAAAADDVDTTVMLASTWLYRRRRNNYGVLVGDIIPSPKLLSLLPLFCYLLLLLLLIVYCFVHAHDEGSTVCSGGCWFRFIQAIEWLVVGGVREGGEAVYKDSLLVLTGR